MTDWGIPDWRDRSAYGDTRAWSESRWHWEFIRRREDCREDFLAHAEKSHQLDRELSDQILKIQKGDHVDETPGLDVVRELARRLKVTGQSFSGHYPAAH